MFKKALQVVTAFGVLLACYAGYVRVFAVVARSVSEPARRPVSFARSEPKTAREAKARSVKAFGRDHWSAKDDLPIRIYNAERGLWIYADDYKWSADGRQLELSPFALVWDSRDGKGFKTATSDRAKIDLDRPFNLVVKPGASSSLHVVHARLEGDVRMRDDKGTDDTADDQRIGPMTYIEYDEPSLQIASESDVVLEDATYRITGVGLLIKLRPRDLTPPRPGAPPPATGFNGAQTVFLKKNVEIVLHDVGPSGMLPGNPSAVAKKGEKTPLRLRCDGVMQVDLPEPRVQPEVGPPSPQGPTLAQFDRNVEVLRGPAGAAPDQLNCDHLRLTLVPANKGKGEGTEKSGSNGEAAAGAAGSNLTLKRAEATGHNVRLVSAGQGVKARCNELIHKKQLPEAPDETYFRGDPTTRLIVEKTDVANQGPNKGKVTSYTTIRAIDASVFDDGRGNENAMVVARGPGEMETRPDKDKPVERTAKWLDQLDFRPNAPVAAKAGEAAPAAAPASKILTLTGRPVFRDLTTSSSLEARRTLVVWLEPKSKADPAAKPGPGGVPGGSSYDLRRLFALGDVHLKQPGKHLTARDRLDAVFASEPGPSAAPPTAGAAAAPPAKPPALVAGSSAAPAAGAGEKEAPARPAEPETRASANRVWASLRVRPATPGAAPAAETAPSLLGGGGLGSGNQTELDEVRLRGSVAFHQDPAPGKTKGTEVVGQAVDVINKGENRTLFRVFSTDGPAQASSRPGAEAPLAKVETDEMRIRGQVIGLDQATDQAWVDGRGEVTQTAARGLLSEKGLPAARPKTAAAGSKLSAGPKTTTMTISFAQGMKFFGQSTDLRGKPAARAEFYKNVHAETEDASMDCDDVMRTFLDRTVRLVNLKTPAPSKGDAGAKARDDDPKPEVAIIECLKNVVVVNSKTDPATKALLQRQRIEGDHLVYEKATGEFWLPGPGEVYLYEREGQNPTGAPGPKLGARDDRGSIVLTSAPGTATASSGGREPAVVGRTSPRDPSRLSSDRPAARDPKAGAARTLPPLVVTQIAFTREMHGRFGTGKDTGKPEKRMADFFGDVQAHHARVADGDTVLDPDKLPADGKSITSQVLRVVSEPQPPKSDGSDAPPRYLLRAWENAYALVEDKTIQADTITYDSLYDLFYAYGEDGRDVLIAQQDQVGQPSSVAQGRAAMYNARDGQSRLIEPKSMQLIDSRYGSRPKPVKPADETVKPKLPKRQGFRNPRGVTERKDFTGR